MASVKKGDRLLTPEQVGEILGKSVRWVKRESADYGLDAIRVGGSPRWSENAVYEWLNQQPAA